MWPDRSHTERQIRRSVLLMTVAKFFSFNKTNNISKINKLNNIQPTDRPTDRSAGMKKKKSF